MKTSNNIKCLVIIMCVCTYNLCGQTINAIVKKSNDAKSEGNFVEQYYYLGQAIDLGAKNMDFEAGLAAYHIKAYDLAIGHFENVLSWPRPDWSAYVYQGLCRKSMGDYETAINSFENYLSAKVVPLNEELLDEAKTQITQCKYAQNNPISTHIEVQILGEGINTPESEFAPFLTHDSLLFSRFGMKEGDSDHMGLKFYPYYYLPGKPAATLLQGEQSEAYSTGHYTIVNDTVYYSQCKSESKKNEDLCGLYWLKNEKGLQNKQQISISNQNGEILNVQQPYVYSHSNGKGVFFVTQNTSIPFDYDIYHALITDVNSSPIATSISSVNTNKDEFSPRFDAKKNILYFSTNGRTSYGGFDIYSILDPFQTNSRPKHLPRPINSSFDDLYYTPSHYDFVFYFSSNRLGTNYLNPTQKTCCFDILKAEIQNEKQIIVDLQVTDSAQNEPNTDPIPIKPIEPTTFFTKNRIITQANLYFANDQPSGTNPKDYQYYFHRYLDHIDTYLSQNKKLSNFLLQEVPKEFAELQTMVFDMIEALENNQMISLKIESHTSPRANSIYNQKLSQRRSESVWKYINDYFGVAIQKYIDSKSLIVVIVDNGENLADKHINSQIQNPKESIYSLEASKARKVTVRWDYINN